MRRSIPLIVLCLPPVILSAQTEAVQFLGQRGGIVKPAGDATLSNIVLGSGVTPGGNLHYTKDLYAIRPDSGTVQQLTTFPDQSGSPGITSVAISQNGAIAAYLGIFSRSGAKTEEVHAVDLASGNDRLISVDMEGCLQPACANCFVPCLHDLHFSFDGNQLIWVSSQPRPVFVGSVSGSGVVRLPVDDAQLAASPNVVTSDGKLVFVDSRNASVVPYSIQLNGSGLTQLPYGPLTSDLIVSADGRSFVWQYASSGFYEPAFFSIQSATTSARTVDTGSKPYSSLTVSADGSQIAFVHDRQAWTNQQITNFQYSDVLDVALSSSGARLLYSTAEINSGRRAAVWTADVNGGNSKLVFGPGSINPNGVVGINSQGLPLALSPGSYFTIYGSNLHGKDELLTGKIPVAVSAGNLLLPLQALTPWQVNAFLPMNVPAGSLTLSLALEGGAQLEFPATVNQTAPALITYPDATGRTQAAAFHLSTLIPCDTRNPARSGEVIETYGFGLGITDPIQAANSPAPLNPLAKTVATPVVTIAAARAQILYSGLVPSVIGVYQVNIVTPSLPAGDYQMNWSTADQTPVSQGSFSIR